MHGELNTKCVQSNSKPIFPHSMSVSVEEDQIDNFQDLESILNSFTIGDTKKSKPTKRRRSLASSMKFWKTKENQK